jgi:spore germination protein
MDIYLVQPGDNIYSIADKYGVQAERLVQDNGLVNPAHLVYGQAIVIPSPKLTYTVQEGDTLKGIANAYGVTLMQLLRNNPSLSDSEFLYPGEILTVSYPTNEQIKTNGFVYPYVKKETLIRALPNLTYLSVFNYQATEHGGISAYQDDSEIIQTAKDYGTVPIMMTATFTSLGQPNIETAYDILLHEEYQNRHINNILNMIKNKGYYGVNMTFNYMNASNQALYEKFIIKAANQIHKEGFLFLQQLILILML